MSVCNIQQLAKAFSVAICYQSWQPSLLVLNIHAAFFEQLPLFYYSLVWKCCRAIHFLQLIMSFYRVVCLCVQKMNHCRVIILPLFSNDVMYLVANNWIKFLTTWKTLLQLRKQKFKPLLLVGFVKISLLEKNIGKCNLFLIAFEYFRCILKLMYDSDIFFLQLITFSVNQCNLYETGLMVNISLWLKP